MPTDDNDRIIVDPSLLLQGAALDWLETPPDLFAVSRSFCDELRQGRIGPFSGLLPPDQPHAADVFGERALAFAEQATIYSAEDNDLDDTHCQITRELLERGDPLSLVCADEWVYLHSHSIMFSALRNPLDAFRRAGAAVIEYGVRFLDEAIDVVIPRKHRDSYNVRELIARGTIKWVVVGASAVGGALIGGLGALLPVPAIPAVRAFDP